MGHLVGLTLLPPKPGTCPQCAVGHPANWPHNAESLFYQYHFYNEHGRWPTWSDALAHCDDTMRAHWTAELAKRGIAVVSPVIPSLRDSAAEERLSR